MLGANRTDPALRSHRLDELAQPLSVRRCRQALDDVTRRDSMLEPFEGLIGTWATQATHPLFDGVVPGSVTFAWIAGGHFLFQRSRNDHELFPDAVCIIGAPEAGVGLVMEYFDSRGVRRTYGVSVEDGEWRMWRDHLGFDQRFSAKLGQDTFEGLPSAPELRRSLLMPSFSESGSRRTLARGDGRVFIAAAMSLVSAPGRPLGPCRRSPPR